MSDEMKTYHEAVMRVLEEHGRVLDLIVKQGKTTHEAVQAVGTSVELLLEKTPELVSAAVREAFQSHERLIKLEQDVEMLKRKVG